MKTFKQILEAIKDKADEGEYDYEGDMAKSQLRSIIANSKRIHDMLDDTTNLPEWVQSKITLAEDYISTASNYMQSEMTEATVTAGIAGIQPDETPPVFAKTKKNEKLISKIIADMLKRKI
jgi:serine protease inhibitor